MTMTYRPGGLAALMDEYYRAGDGLINTLQRLDAVAFAAVHPAEADDCRMIKLIVQHVVRSAYGYANRIRQAIDVPVTIEPPSIDTDRDESITAIENALQYTSESFDGKWQMSDEDLDSITMMSSWNVRYSIEQMMEHAIVHLLRHRRQIARLAGL